MIFMKGAIIKPLAPHKTVITPSNEAIKVIMLLSLLNIKQKNIVNRLIDKKHISNKFQSLNIFFILSPTSFI